MSNAITKKEVVKFCRKSNLNGIYSVNLGVQILIKNREVFETSDKKLIKFFDEDVEITRLKEEKIKEFNEVVLTDEEKKNIKTGNDRMKEAEVGLDNEQDEDEEE